MFIQPKKKNHLRIVSWNVNGIRAVLKKGFMEFLAASDADILCLQETKARPEQVEQDWPTDREIFWNPAERPGYSGTAILSRLSPLRVTCGIGIEEHDREGRVLTAEFENFYLVNVYVPNSKSGLERLPYREKKWEPAFLKYLKKLEKKKPVIFCGDMNVAHTEIDLARPENNARSAGFTDEERGCVSNMIDAGFIESVRKFEQGGGHYSWWSYRAGARIRNVGWRIDYVCTSPTLSDAIMSAYICPEVMGSDHCPVGADFAISSTLDFIPQPTTG
ncbi:MAG: exodeoxyribonuclease III [Chthoniobacterales bacterium]